MNSRYLVKQPLGSGGVGAVYLATDQQLQRDVAIKRLHLEGEEGEEATEALMKEATTLSALNHPNIVTVHDIGADEQGPYVVMEYVQGETFEDLVKRGALSWSDFQQVAIQTLEGLIAAQHHGLVHRDIKPGNLMLTWRPSGSFDIKLLDFGLAKFSPKPSKQTVDQGDAIMGSIYFMAPEQFERRELDARTDLYSLGGVFYYGLTGHYPFDGQTAAEVMASHLMNRYERLDGLRPDVPVWAREWVHWLLRRHMEDRPVDATAALQSFLRQGEGIPPDPATGRQVLRAVSPRARQSTAPVAHRPPPTGAASRPTGRVATAPGHHAPAQRHTAAVPTLPPPRKRTGLWVGLAAGVLALAAGAWFFLGRGPDQNQRAQQLLTEARSGSTVIVGQEADFDLLYPLLNQGRAEGSDGAVAATALTRLSWGGMSQRLIARLNEETDANTLENLMFIAAERNIVDLLPTLVANLNRYQGPAETTALAVIRQTLERGVTLNEAEFLALINEIDRANPAVREELAKLLTVAATQSPDPAAMVQSLLAAARAQGKNPVTGLIVRQALAGSGRPEAIEFLVAELRGQDDDASDLAAKALAAAPGGAASGPLTDYAVEKLELLRADAGSGNRMGRISDAQGALSSALAQVAKLEGDAARVPFERLIGAIDRADFMSTVLREGLSRRDEGWAETLVQDIKAKFPLLGTAADSALRDIQNRRGGLGA